MNAKRGQLVHRSERDESVCGACGAHIPNLPGGALRNHFHAVDCEFYASPAWAASDD